MQRPAVQHTTKVLFRGPLFIRMDELEERFGDETVCLGAKMVGEDRVEVEKAEI